jgi:ABC-type antimicrobial peptide transport system permease subunit
MNPSMPVSELRTMDEIRAASVATPRFTAALLGSFAVVALGLSVVGLYGVLSYAVNQRRKEIGIRMALGAPGSRVVRDVLGEGTSVIGVGLAVGLLAALGMTGLLEGMVYGIEATDPVTFVAVPALFLIVSLVATWIPAARASRTEPSAALTAE